MRIALLLIILSTSSLIASNSFSQNARVSINVRNAMIKDVLLEIKKQTDYSFLYNNNELDENIQVTLNMDNATIDKVLDIALKNQDLKYEVENNVIVIYKPRTANERDMNRDLSQNRRKITGKVTDSSTHEPLIGVSISITGASGGTITDQDGNFSIDVPEGVTLHISYIGFASQSIKIGNQTHLNIVMQEDSKVLSEVVIVGFGTQKKINLTGAVAAIDSKVFEERPVSSAVQALQGAVSGLNIFNSGNGGELNAAKEINVRGTGTIGSESKGNPLILIDGMEGDINTINPQDIENISVLKDASASAIYGSRAPFGVILVTTKMGKKGRPVVNYNNNFRFNTPIMLPEMANSWEFVNYFNDGNFNNAGSYVYDAAHLQDIKDYIDGKKDPNDTMPINATSGKWNTGKAYANVDWMQEYYKDWSSSQEHNISISGGGDNMTYYLSANYQGQDGFLRYGTDKHRRYTITGKISAKLTDYLKVDYSNRFGRTDYDRPTQMSSNVYSEILRRSTPIIPVKDPNGYYVSDSHFIENFVNGGRHAEQKDDMSQQVKITLSPVTGWNIIGEMNFRTTNTWIDEASKMTYGHMAEDPEMTYRAYLSPTTDNVYGYAYRSTFLNPNIYTNYNRSFGIHNLGLTGGMQHENSKARLMSAKRNGIIVQDLPVLDLTSDNSVIDIKGNRNRWVTTGFFGRLNYDIDNRYLFEFNLRYDGTSRFRRDNRWVWTTSASVGWNVASEKFFEGLREYVEVLKPRVSYGELPNQNTTSLYPTYQTIPTSIGGGLWLLDGARPNTGASPKLVSTVLTWEKVSTLNIGVDWNAFRNRLTGSFDYFTRKTKDMVGPGVELPASLGAAVPNTNNTDLKTYGWELEIAWRDKINDFSYGAGINLSDAQTRITKYPNPTGLLSKYLEGELLGDIYGYTTIGIAKSDDEMNAHLAALPEGGQSVIGSNWRAGDIMYADINGDGKVSNGSNTIHDMGDLKKIGNTTPRYMFGINLNAAWKGIDLSMFWQGVLKRDFYPDANPSGASGDQNMVFWGITQSGRFYSTAFKEHLDYFRADEDHNLGQNLDAYYARPLFNTKNKVTQTKYLQNAAYMRLKNLQIGYTFPQQWTHKIKLERLRFYVSGENLLTFTNFTKTMDPETAGIGKKGGVVYPLSRTYSFGLSANF